MLRPEFLNRFRSNPDTARKAVGLSISLLVHFIVIMWLLHTKITVRVLTAPPRVRDVIIASKDKLSIPGDLDKHIQNPPEEEALEPGRPRRKRRIVRPHQPVPPFISGSPDGPGGPESAAEGSVAGSWAPDFSIPSLESRPGLDLSSRYKPKEGGGLRINLSKNKEAAIPATRRPSESDERYADLLQYLGPDMISGPATGSGRPGAGPARPVQKAVAAFNIRDYDIRPWAEEAINRIQVNWNIPALENIPPRSEVIIAVTIEKDGAMSSHEILKSSTLPVLDLAAVDAVEKSSPFPVLPGDFPASNLQATLVFSYHE